MTCVYLGLQTLNGLVCLKLFFQGRLVLSCYSTLFSSFDTLYFCNRCRLSKSYQHLPFGMAEQHNIYSQYQIGARLIIFARNVLNAWNVDKLTCLACFRSLK